MDRHRDEEATRETIISYVTMQTAADVEKEREGNRGEEEERSGNKKVERTARPRLKNNHMGRLWNQIITAHIYVFSEATTFSPRVCGEEDDFCQERAVHVLCEAKSQQGKVTEHSQLRLQK